MSSEWFAKVLLVNYNPDRSRMRKAEQIGLRVPAELKKTLVQIAKAEDRSLAQICEIFLRGAALSYREEGPKYLQRLVTKQRDEAEG